ncbi:MAG: ABC transporter ATP-binding protein/permease [Saprospiraceae bacterium]|nr:ABC transporter ATP-binding protein/permease [Saprospiraceae bacterium]
MNQEPKYPMRRLFSYLDHYRTQLWFASSTTVVHKLFDLMPPFLTAWIIDTVSDNPPAWISQYTGLTELWDMVIFIIVLTIFIFFGESLTEWLYKRNFMQLAQRMQHDLRMDAYQQLQSREIAYFEEQRTGNLMALLNDDVNQLERFLNNIFNEIIQLIILVIFAGWSLCAVSLELGLLSMTPIPLIVLASFYYQRKIAPYYKSVRESVGNLSSRLENNISGIMVIKSFTAEKFEAERVREASLKYRDDNFKAIQWSSIYTPIIRIFITIGFAAALLIGASWVLFEPGRFSLGSLAFFAMMIQRLLWPVTRLGFIFDEYERARASARRIFGLLDTPNQLKEADHPKEISQTSGHLELRNVHFAYRADQPILTDINLDIQSGQTIGVAGPTGGGKTTLIKLLLRLYDVKQGGIFIDQTDIRELSLHGLRQKIALVSQDVYLFHGSIRENIAYGTNDTSLEAIIQASRKAQLHEFVASLPDGYDTMIGEKGIKLSGGQRQRLSIARAILKNAPILILDEATSAVDTQTEQAIQSSLRQLTADKTAIIIAHRLSTIRQADQIVVLKQGRITEQGSHEDLLLQQGDYAELWRIQTGEITA